MGLSSSISVIPGEAQRDARDPMGLSICTAPRWVRGSRGLRRLARDDSGAYFIACGLIGLPVPPVMISGGPQKKNS